MKKLSIKVIDTKATEVKESTSVIEQVAKDAVKVHGEEVPNKVVTGLKNFGKKVKNAELGSRLAYGTFVAPVKGALVTKDGAKTLKEKAADKLVEQAIRHEQRKEQAEARRLEKEALKAAETAEQEAQQATA